MDRELTLWESRIIMEYLDERFPHPPLMPVYPVARGESRLYMHRIEKDWYTLMNTIINGSASEADAARKQLREELLAMQADVLRCCGVCRNWASSSAARVRKS